MQHKLTEIFKKAPLSSTAMPRTSHVTKLILMQNHYLIFGSYSIDIDMEMVHFSGIVVTLMVQRWWSMACTSPDASLHCFSFWLVISSHRTQSSLTKWYVSWSFSNWSNLWACSWKNTQTEIVFKRMYIDKIILNVWFCIHLDLCVLIKQQCLIKWIKLSTT